MKNKDKKHEKLVYTPDGDALIEVKDLVKDFNNGEIKVLRGIDYKIKRGEKIVIVGPSGGGKSTFLRCLFIIRFILLSK